MSVTLKELGQQGNEYAVALTGQLNFDTASDALKLVRDAIASQSAVNIDLSEISSANSAGLALMAEWKAEASNSGKSVRFSNVPQSLRGIAEICQVESLLFQ